MTSDIDVDLRNGRPLEAGRRLEAERRSESEFLYSLKNGVVNIESFTYF